MKQKLLSLVVTFVAMFACVGSMQAQTVKGQKFEVGKKYILQNVAYGTYVSTDYSDNGHTTSDINAAAILTCAEKKNVGQYMENSEGNALNPYRPSFENPAGLKTVLYIDQMSNEGDDYIYAVRYTLGLNKIYLGEDGERNLNNKSMSEKDAKTNSFYHWRLFPVEEADLTINSSAEYGTFVAPFDVTLPEGVTAYTIASTTGTPEADGVANFTAIEGNVLPACTPAVVYKAGGQETMIYKGVPTTTAETVTGANGLVGVLTDGKTAPENSYVINYINDHTAFYIVRSNISVGKNRCYLAPQAEGAAKIAFSFGNPTAVTSVNANATVSAIYNAAGARVSAAQKGMNIIKYSDGSVKKVLVK